VAKISRKQRTQPGDLLMGSTGQHRGAMATSSHKAKHPLTPGTASPTYRLIPGKHLDLLLLAVCSCLLTLLCHPSSNLLPAAGGASSSALESSLPASATTQMNFYIKSVLMSSYQEKGKQEEEGV
jgi:hypothetical protein